MRKIGGGDARGAGVPQRGAYRLSALNVEEVQDDARVRAEGTAEADVGEQRVGDLPRRAGHAYPQDLLRRHASAVRPAAEARRSRGPRANTVVPPPPPEIWRWSSMECCSTAAFLQVLLERERAFLQVERGEQPTRLQHRPPVRDAGLAHLCAAGGCVPLRRVRSAPLRAPARTAPPASRAESRLQLRCGGGGLTGRARAAGVGSYSRHAADLAEKAANKKDGLALDADDVAVRTRAPHARCRSSCARRARPHAAAGRWVCAG